MPAVITHDLFGKDAYADVSALLRFSSFDQHDAFLLGNQGPDPLFFLIMDPRVDAHNSVGDRMHDERPAHLICALRDSLSMLSERERPVGEAYAAGFLCHYLLDSSLHPLIISQEKAICTAGIEGLDEDDGGEVHAEIERDLDEMVLYTKLGKTIAEWRPYQEILSASDEVLAIIDKMYFYTVMWAYSIMLDLDAFTNAVKAFRLTLRLFWSTGGPKHDILSEAYKLLFHKRYSLYGAMAHHVRAERISDFDNHEHRAWSHPFEQGTTSTESFWDLYEEALSRVFDVQTSFFAKGFDLRDAEKLTGFINFSGKKVEEDVASGADGNAGAADGEAKADEAEPAVEVEAETVVKAEPAAEVEAQIAAEAAATSEPAPASEDAAEPQADQE